MHLLCLLWPLESVKRNSKLLCTHTGRTIKACSLTSDELTCTAQCQQVLYLGICFKRWGIFLLQERADNVCHNLSDKQQNFPCHSHTVYKTVLKIPFSAGFSLFPECYHQIDHYFWIGCSHCILKYKM